ncbi:MAG: E3 binding domain-containing protein, partial [Actinobacteria bacterium]|nr:E3 binding domain-containing protein [Actinomycetota bacterium]
MAVASNVDVVMPQMGSSVTEGTISRWLKQVGDTVQADETIVEISTDKVDTEVPSPTAGVVMELLVAEGVTVDVGTRIAVLSTDLSATPSAAAPVAAPPAEVAAPVEAAPVAAAPVEAAPVAAAPVAAAPVPVTQLPTSGEDRAFVSPVVARMVAEHQLDITQITGTGRGGRVTKKDVENFLAARASGGGYAAPMSEPTAVAPPAAGTPVAPVATPPAAAPPVAAPTPAAPAAAAAVAAAPAGNGE